MLGPILIKPYSAHSLKPSLFKFNLIVNDDQQDATIYVYLIIPSQLYMFREKFSPIIRSTWLYLQLLVMSTDVAAGW